MNVRTRSRPITTAQPELRAGWGLLAPHPSSCTWERSIVGGIFLVTAGVHIGIFAADPHTYAHFASDGLFSFVRDGWRDIFMAHPSVWGLALALGEATLGVLLLLGPPTARVGWVGVWAFHLALLLFGFGFWSYALPALTVLAVLAIRDLRPGDS